MPIFGKDEGLTSEQEVKSNLAQIAGGLAGSGAGLLASIPLDARYQNQLLEEGQKLTRDKEIAEKNWRILLKLYKGEIQLEDLPIEQRQFFAKQLAENAEDLKYMARNPREGVHMFKGLQSGKVATFPGVNRAEMKGLFAHKVRSPYSGLLPGALGLAGMIGAGAATRKHYLKENQEE